MIVFNSLKFNSFKFLILLIFCIHPLKGEIPSKNFTFFDLEGISKTRDKKEQIHEGEFIQIKGFLYETSHSQLILAAEPNLKSCCVGSEGKKYKQLLVLGDVNSAINQQTAITLKGSLTINPNSFFPYQLENATVVEENNQLTTLIIIGFFSLLILMGIMVFKCIRHRE